MGYGHPTEVVFGSTLPLFQGLRRGDSHVTMEIWLPNQDEAWMEAQAAGGRDARHDIRRREDGFGSSTSERRRDRLEDDMGVRRRCDLDGPGRHGR